MNKLQKDILKTQKLDPLSIAEDLTGQSYKESEATSALGFMLHIQKGQKMRDMLAKAGDTQFSSTVKDYLRITGDFGFEVVYKEPFMTDRCEENLYVLFQKELGILICFDTFTWENGSQPGVNGGNMYYNWSPNTIDIGAGLTSSGHYCFDKKAERISLFEKDLITKYEIENYPEKIKWENEVSWEEFIAIQKPIEKEQRELFELAISCGKRVVWIGGHDCREGIITIIKALFENGRFLPVWHESPFKWLTNYMEHKNNNHQHPFTEYYNVTKQRIARMPKHVQDCIADTYKP